jgi:hypothetical protein
MTPSSVMPGQSSLLRADYVYLSALPGIHVFQSNDKQDVDGRAQASGSDAVLRTAMPGHDEVLRPK